MRNNFLKITILLNLAFFVVGCAGGWEGAGVDIFKTGAVAQGYDLETKERLDYKKPVYAHVVYNRFISIGAEHPKGGVTSSSLHLFSPEELDDKSINPFIEFLTWAKGSYEQREKTKDAVFKDGVLVVNNYNGPHIWTVDNDKETKEPLLIEHWKQNWWSVSRTYAYTVPNSVIILARAIQLKKNFYRKNPLKNKPLL